MAQSKDNRLTCEEIEELVPDLLYGELDDERAAQVRARLPECELSDKVAGYERLREAMRSLPDEEPPAAISAQLMHAAAKQVEGAQRAGERRGFWDRLRAWFGPIGLHPGFAAAASLLVVAGVAGLLYVRGADRSAGPKAPTRAAPPSGESRPDTAAPAAPATVPPADEEAKEEPPAADLDNAWVGGEAGAAPRTRERADSADKRVPSKAPARKRSKRSSGKLDMASGGGGLLDGLDDGSAAGDATGYGGASQGQRGPGGTAKDQPEADGFEQQLAEPEPEAEAAPAEAPPPPPTKKRKTKNRGASSSELKKLHGQAAAAAKAGDCAKVRSIGARIERLDGAYYSDVFRRDAAIRACDGVAK